MLDRIQKGNNLLFADQIFFIVRGAKVEVGKEIDHGVKIQIETSPRPDLTPVSLKRDIPSPKTGEGGQPLLRKLQGQVPHHLKRIELVNIECEADHS